MTMNCETIISAALRALPSDNMRKEEMFAVEGVIRMAIDLVAGGVQTRPNGDAEGTIRELTAECIARARRIDELEKEVAGLVSDNWRIVADRGMAIEAIGDGVDVTNSLRNELDVANDTAEEWRLKAGARSIELAQAHNEKNKRLRELWEEQAALQKELGELKRSYQYSVIANINQGDQLRYAQLTIIELEQERTKLNQQAFSMALELDAEKKKVGELFRDIAAERELVSKLTAENALLQQESFKPATFRIGDIPEELAGKSRIPDPNAVMRSGGGGKS